MSIMESILEHICEERVFEMIISDDKKQIIIEECCDRCFEVKLNKQQALLMIKEITHIVNQLED